MSQFCLSILTVFVFVSVLLTVSWAIPTGGDKEPAKVTSTKNATEQPPPPPEPRGDKFNEFDWRLCKVISNNFVISLKRNCGRLVKLIFKLLQKFKLL